MLFRSRFKNEIAAIHAQGGKIVWVQRGIIPHWYDIATQANKGDTKAIAWLKNEGIHASEYSWAGTVFDMIISNNGSIEDLYSQLKNLALEDSVSMAA